MSYLGFLPSGAMVCVSRGWDVIFILNYRNSPEFIVLFKSTLVKIFTLLYGNDGVIFL